MIDWNGDERELVRYRNLATKEGWIRHLEDDGHVWFYLDDRFWFIFPEGAHKYGLCYGEDEKTGNFARWVFESEMDFLQAPLFKNGTNLLDRIDEVLYWDP